MKCLLVVDDELPVLHALRRLLQLHFRPQELDVELSTDPLNALQRLHQARFDVIISDYRMPQLDGVTLLVRAKELDPRAVRMMLSAAADFGIVLDAINRAEVFRYLHPEAVARTTVACGRASRAGVRPLRHPEPGRTGTPAS